MKRHQPPHRRGHRNRAALWPLRLHRTRVLAIQCSYCRQWVKPRYIRWPAAICRSCGKEGLNQTWQPAPAHLARAAALADQDHRVPALTDHTSTNRREGGTP
jgi:hypothetical protein